MAGFYNPYYPQQYFTSNQQPQQSYQQPVVQQPQIQNGGFVSVRNETEARNYPVAPGNSITFKDETAPYIYTKTMGFSQLDRPIFERYRLVREEAAISQEEPVKENPKCSDEWRNEFNKIKTEIESLKEEAETLRGDVDVLKEQATRKKDDSVGGGN